MNPAQRLLSIYDKLVQQPDNTETGIAWANTFSINTELDFEDDLVISLVALREHMQFVCNLLPSFGIESEFGESGLTRFKQYASPAIIHGNFMDIKRFLLESKSRETLKWASALLSSLDEEEANEHEINEILEAIRLLEIDIISIEMSPNLRHFIVAQIKALKKSVLSARIKGAQSLRSAVTSYTGEVIIHSDQLNSELADAEEEVKGVFSKLGGIVERVAETGDKADKLIKLAQYADAAYKVIKPYLLPFLP
ncbi:MAG: hypothetical protein ACTS9Y_13770 [Methylophilus sp.]|uniref:hypothetical protein n=1 Tax=Methylophilus sp. TaxID=29541 RepID=UPI003F9F523B